MPLDAYAIGAGLRAVLAQRLVRRLCSDCRECEPATLGEREKLARACHNQRTNPLLGWVFEPDLVLWRGKGCKACTGTGYHGRMALQELLIVDGELRQLIAQRASTDALRTAAEHNGMITLLQDGIAKALAGYTDVEEVLAACSVR